MYPPFPPDMPLEPLAPPYDPMLYLPCNFTWPKRRFSTRQLNLGRNELADLQTMVAQLLCAMTAGNAINLTTPQCQCSHQYVCHCRMPAEHIDAVRWQ